MSNVPPSSQSSASKADVSYHRTRRRPHGSTSQKQHAICAAHESTSRQLTFESCGLLDTTCVSPGNVADSMVTPHVWHTSLTIVRSVAGKIVGTSA